MAMAMAVSVPYDVVLEILLRVKDVITIFRCATTCKSSASAYSKGWRRLLAADPSVLRRCLPEDVCRSAPFAGFFTQQRPRRGPPVPCLVPAPRPVLDPRRRPLSFFFPDLDDHRYFDHAIPLASRHGLLLVRLDLCRAGIDPDASGDLLAVCNLLAGTIHVLPRLERSCDFDDHEATGYAMLTGADHSNNNDHQQELLGSFKVLVIGILASWEGNTMLYGLRTFSSSGEPMWNTCAGSVNCSNYGARLWQHSAAVCGGMARWLFWGLWGLYAFGVSVETNNFPFTRVHDRMHPQYEPYISVDSEGRLALFFMQRNGPQLLILTLDDNNRIWSRARVLELKQENQHKEQPLVGYTCLGEKNGTLIIKDSFQHVYFADAATGVMHEVKKLPTKCKISRKRTVSIDMD
ncbi:hypothetical protein ACQ4PT_058420 [Festuca glaucescens]